MQIYLLLFIEFNIDARQKKPGQCNPGSLKKRTIYCYSGGRNSSFNLCPLTDKEIQ